MSDKKRTTISIHSGILAKAHELMHAENFNDFSNFLEQLIREKWAAQQSKHLELRDAPATTPPPPAPAQRAKPKRRHPDAEKGS